MTPIKRKESGCRQCATNKERCKDSTGAKCCSGCTHWPDDKETVPSPSHGEKGWGSSYSSPGPDAFYARCACGEKFYGRTVKQATDRRWKHIQEVEPKSPN